MTLDPTKPIRCSNREAAAADAPVCRPLNTMGKIGLKATNIPHLAGVATRSESVPAISEGVWRWTPSTLTSNLQTLVAVGWLSVGAGAMTAATSSPSRTRDARSAPKAGDEGCTDSLNELLGVERVLALHDR